MIKHQNLICIGAVAAVHGIRGEIKVKSFTQLPQSLLSYTPLYIASVSKDEIIPLTHVKGRLFKKDVVILQCQEIKDRTAAEQMIHQEIYIQRDQLSPTYLNEGEVYYHDLIGLNVVNEHNYNVGKVAAVHNFGAGDVLDIKLGQSNIQLVNTQLSINVMVPSQHPDVGSPDKDQQTIVVQQHLIDAFLPD